jgi:hypothetical protein
MSNIEQTEKEEPHITEEFAAEIEKYAKLEGLSPKELLEQAARNYLKKLKQIYPDKESLCPSGCGTKLVKHKFVEVLSEPENTEEDLYCEKCGIRWIAEQHEPLNTEKAKTAENNVTIEFYDTEEVTLKIPTPFMDLLRHSQAITGDTPRQDMEYAIVESIRARIDGGQFLPTRETLVKQYNLNPLFKAILDCPIE